MTLPSAACHSISPVSALARHSPSAYSTSVSRPPAGMPSASCVSERMSTRTPVRRAARRAFWPSRPIARLSWWSGTITSAAVPSSEMWTAVTFAGDSALATKSARSSLNGTMSIFSPRSSLTTMRTRPPRAPTHAPTGSTLWSFDQTAIFVRWPGSRAQALISTMPSAISGTSSSNRRLIRPGWVRETTICGPLGVRRTSTM